MLAVYGIVVYGLSCQVQGLLDKEVSGSKES